MVILVITSLFDFLSQKVGAGHPVAQGFINVVKNTVLANLDAIVDFIVGKVTGDSALQKAALACPVRGPEEAPSEGNG